MNKTNLKKFGAFALRVLSRHGFIIAVLVCLTFGAYGGAIGALVGGLYFKLDDIYDELEKANQPFAVEEDGSLRAISIEQSDVAR